LNLTAEQEASFRAFLKDDSFPSVDEHEEDLKALLSADQQAAFEQMQDERKQGQQRLDAFQAALFVVSDVQGLVGLSPQQQDKAFPALLEYGRRKLIYDESKSQSYDAWADLISLKLNALKDVLTAEQMQIYRNHEERILKLTKLRFGAAGN
jgi:hypothetical protein